MTEWPKCETCHLEQLKSERDADDRDAIQQSHDCIIKADDKSAKEQPKYVSYKFHICKDNYFQHRVQKYRETARDTIQELEALSQRLEVAGLLHEGKNYVDINKLTGASTATICRISKCLTYGDGGYRTVLERIRQGGSDND